MGNAASTHKITPQDKAILDLKTQRDKLHQYQKRIVRLTDRETAVARACVAAGDKPRARLALRRKKYQQSLLAQTDAQLAQLEQLVHGVEFALVQQSVLHGLRQGNEVLRAIHREIGGLEGVEKLMGETEEARQYQEEVSAMLAGQMSTQDEDEVLDELEAMEREAGAAARTGADTSALPRLPSAPTTEPPLKQGREGEEGAEEEQDGAVRQRQRQAVPS